MVISARGRASYQVSPLKWSPRKHLLHGLVDAFSKAIGLGRRVRGGGHVTNAVFGAKQLPPFTGEARVTIRDDAPREALKAKNVREHQVRGVFGTLSLTSGDKMNHTCCSVGNGKNGIEILSIFSQAHEHSRW